MFKLVSPFEPAGDQIKAIEKLTTALETKDQAVLMGVTGSGKTFTLANLVKNLNKKTLVMAPNKTLAAQLYAEFKEFFPNNSVEYFVSYYDYYRPESYLPGKDVYIEKEALVNENIDKMRHAATSSILERNDVIIVASVSCIYGIGDPEDYAKQKIDLEINKEIDRDKLIEKLVNIQFKRNDYELLRGTFSVKGKTFYINPASFDNQSIKLEFRRDELLKLQLVDPLTNHLIEDLSSITIWPANHYVVEKEKMQHAIISIKEELQKTLATLKEENKLIEYQRLEQRTLNDLEMLEEMGFCSGIENYSRHFTTRLSGEPPPTLLDFFKKDFLLIIDESHLSIPQIRGMYLGDYSRKKNLVDYGFRLPSALDNRPLKFDEFNSRLNKVVYVSATPSNYEIDLSGTVIEQVIRPTGLLDPMIEVRDATNQVDDLTKEIQKVIKKNNKVLVTTLTKKLSEELTRHLVAQNIKTEYLHSDIGTLERIEIINKLRQGIYDVIVGINLLREGLDIPEVALVAILDADKEGFLRSERSLIQTIGRAARNSDGKVIMYAYSMTNSMQFAIDETNRRRKLQEEYNIKNNITPKTIQKEVLSGIIEALKGEAELPDNVTITDPSKIDDRIQDLRKKMKRLSSKLQFEEAAKIRDEIKVLQDLKIL